MRAGTAGLSAGAESTRSPVSSAYVAGLRRLWWCQRTTLMNKVDIWGEQRCRQCWPSKARVGIYLQKVSKAICYSITVTGKEEELKHLASGKRKRFRRIQMGDEFTTHVPTSSELSQAGTKPHLYHNPLERLVEHRTASSQDSVSDSKLGGRRVLFKALSETKPNKQGLSGDCFPWVLAI